MLTCSLQSGSNGNCIFVEADGVRLLFDAGISARQAGVRLAQHGREMRHVDAILLSHAHSDHSRCAGVFQRMFQIPIYATAATHHAIRPYSGRMDDVRIFHPGDTLRFGEVAVHTVPTPHDSRDSVAFVVEHGGKRLGILTDLGHPFAGLDSVVGSLDAVYLESNFDPEMLANGPYPADLQRRIRGLGGHLSNPEAAEVLRRSANGRLRWAALSHLSEHNNRPELALETHRAVLGRQFPLRVASRYGVSEMMRV